MDRLAPASPSPRRRRRYSATFKSRVVMACDEPGRSIAGVARQYGLNANLLHKWRKQARAATTANFVRVPTPSGVTVNATATIRLELPGGIVVHWPMSDRTVLIDWLRLLMP